MFSIYRDEEREGHISYLCDTADDVSSLPTTAAPGSDAVVITTGDVYVLNNAHQWVKFGGEK